MGPDGYDQASDTDESYLGETRRLTFLGWENKIVAFPKVVFGKSALLMASSGHDHDKIKTNSSKGALLFEPIWAIVHFCAFHRNFAKNSQI